MTEQQPFEPEIPEEPQVNDHFLEDLAAATGLFNPAMIVEELQELDRLDTAASAEQVAAHEEKEAGAVAPDPENLP
ncbi:hypothetical protein [Hymenobacter rigui]|uniref:Uncharacterized protein n=1 Tax=Hymenobacter rigui TaxID=334424 RepID=A0A3R9PCA3_9BACT|nr:hypothetical protein [Hymenobacter rigui]RSK48899.1 hypothetical protein EI291_10075 [Hymenobacter rigui]